MENPLKILGKTNLCVDTPKTKWNISESLASPGYRESWAKQFSYYVYVFSEPSESKGFCGFLSDGTFIYIEGSPFYVGKGKGKRCFNHFTPARQSKTPFYQKLKSILRKNPNLKAKDLVTIVKFFENEEEAYIFETFLISEIGSRYIDEIKNGPLKNMNLNNFAISKRNVPKGESHCFSKITEKDVVRILGRLAKKESIKSISTDESIGKNIIKDLKCGNTWKPVLEKFLSENPDVSFCFNRSNFNIKEQKSIILKINEGLSFKEISEKYNIPIRTFYRIKNKQTFKQAWKEIGL